MPSNIKGIENGRAKAAFKCVEDNISGMNKSQKDEFKSHVKSIPMLIKTNGLGATFAFMLSKKKDYVSVGKCFLGWLKQDTKRIINVDEIQENDFKSLVEKITTLSSSEYRALTTEVMAYLNWLRRFAEGLAEGD